MQDMKVLNDGQLTEMLELAYEFGQNKGIFIGKHLFWSDLGDILAKVGEGGGQLCPCFQHPWSKSTASKLIFLPWICKQKKKEILSQEVCFCFCYRKPSIFT